MPKVQKRDNAYYLQRLKKRRPDLYRECQAKRMTVSAARKAAGLGAERTRLHELKNAWTKATTDERRAFFDWLRGLGAATAAIPPGKTAFGRDGVMLAWARKRIAELMVRRGMSSGHLSRELGLLSRDTSIMTAVRRKVKLAADTAKKVDRWLAANRGS